MKITPLKIAFAFGFLAVPGLTWALQISPTLDARDRWVDRQENAMQVQKSNAELPAQRRDLEADWNAFEPVANEALANLSSDLNPHLVPKRLRAAAEKAGCMLDINPMNTGGGGRDYGVRFSITGEGRYQDLVELIDQLEQGQHFVRVEDLSLTLPSANYESGRTGAVRIAAVVMIPRMPDLGNGVEE